MVSPDHRGIGHLLDYLALENSDEKDPVHEAGPEGSMVKWRIALAVLLVMLVCVGPVQAWYLADRDGTAGSQLSGGPWKSFGNHIYSWTTTTNIGYATSYPTTDWTAYASS
ncbi:MAG: hypothetical protein PHG80_12310, partial [Methanoregulaceae archaeon]|nr:hypothetical protein [Methanoregulaceae archaeon]